MFMKFSNQSLETQVQDNSIVYGIESLQCKDMGTYICKHKNDEKEKASVDVVMTSCAPQLCPGKRVKDIYYSTLENKSTFTFCVISQPHQRVSMNLSVAESSAKLVPTITHSSSTIYKSDIYRSIDITMSNLKKEDSGEYTIRLYNVESSWQATEFKVELHESSGFPLTLNITNDKPKRTLTCKSSVYPASSLDIFLKTSEEPLHHEVRGNSVIYRFVRPRCEDMGTYECRLAGNPSRSTSTDLVFPSCGPQLCHGEDRDRVIFAELNAKITFSLCLITREKFSLLNVSVEVEGMTKTLSKDRYNIMTLTGQDLYHTVHITMYNIQRGDYGTVTFNFHDLRASKNEMLLYKIQLKEKAHNSTLVTDGPTDDNTPWPPPGHPMVQTTDSTSSQSSGEISTGALAAVIVVIIIAAVAVMGGTVVCVLVYRKLAGRKSAMMAGGQDTQLADQDMNVRLTEDTGGHGPHTTTGLTENYEGDTSEQGLVYATPDHARTTGQQEPNRAKLRQDKTIYATLNFEQTGRSRQRQNVLAADLRKNLNNAHEYVNVRDM